MSSLRRTLEGDVLVHHLKRDEQMIDQSLLARHGRTARTLVKEGPLRLTVIALAAGGVPEPPRLAQPAATTAAHAPANCLRIEHLDWDVDWSAARAYRLERQAGIRSVELGPRKFPMHIGCPAQRRGPGHRVVPPHPPLAKRAQLPRPVSIARSDYKVRMDARP